MIKALIIDDHPVNIEMLKAFLGLCNVEAIGALSGSEGFSLAQNYQPDVIFLDLLMPEQTWDGYTTCHELKSHPATSHIPIVIVTAAGDERRAHEVGADFFLARPFQVDNLRGVLANLGLLAQ